MPSNPSNPSDLDCAKGTAGETGLNAQVREQVVKKLLTVFGDAALSPNLEEEDPTRELPKKLSGGGHRALFHLMQTAYFQASHRFAGGLPIKFMERQRWVTIQDQGIDDGQDIEVLCKNSNSGCFYKRRRIVDIVLGEGDVTLQGQQYRQTGAQEPETWVELKSYAAVADVGNARYEFAFTKSPKFGGILTPWEIKGVQNKKNWSAHLQFSLDRAAETIGYAWLAKNESGSKLVNARQEVGDFMWRFQAFKTYTYRTKKLHEISPKLGASNYNVGSFRALVHKRPSVKTSNTTTRANVQDFSFGSDGLGFEGKAQLTGVNDLAALIIQAGFIEIADGEDLTDMVDIDY